jgi:uncharacterized protein (DUF433 family)
MEQSIEHIVSDPNTCFGKPRIAGTRFAVKDVVAHHLFNRMPVETIAVKWKLPLAAVYVALAFYYDHREEIDKSFADDDEYIRRMKMSSQSILDEPRPVAHPNAERT